jgi:hypothetical protein
MTSASGTVTLPPETGAKGYASRMCPLPNRIPKLGAAHALPCARGARHECAHAPCSAAGVSSTCAALAGTLWRAAQATPTSTETRAIRIGLYRVSAGMGSLHAGHMARTTKSASLAPSPALLHLAPCCMSHVVF